MGIRIPSLYYNNRGSQSKGVDAILSIMYQPDWHSDAACIGKWELFDEPSGDREIEACRTICFTQCPVRNQCLHDALKTEDPYFVRNTFRGGYMPTERSKIMGTISRKNWTWEDSKQF